MLTILSSIAAENMLCQNSVKFGIHTACKLSASSEAYPYNTFIPGVTLPYDVALPDKSVYRDGKCTGRNSQIFGGGCHCTRLIRSYGGKCMHLSNGKIREISSLQRLLFCEYHILENPYKSFRHDFFVTMQTFAPQDKIYRIILQLFCDYGKLRPSPLLEHFRALRHSPHLSQPLQPPFFRVLSR